MRTNRGISFLVVCAVAAVPGFGLSSCERGEGHVGEVVLYCSVDQGFAEGIIADFEQRTRVHVRVRFDEEARKTTGLVQRLRAEAANPAADVFWSSEIFQTIRLAEEGLLEPYRGEATRRWPAQFADPNGRWHAFALRMRAIAYDTRRVQPGEAPKSLEDVLDPKWKGRIVMARPHFGTTRGDLASWFVHYGPDRAKDILRRLKANDVRSVQGNSTAVRKVANGEADVCFTDTDDVYVAQRNGWPIAMNPLDQGGEGALAIPNTAALVRGGSNPVHARKLLAYLLSEKVERDLARSESHNVPVRPALAAEFPKYAFAKALEVDYRQVARRQREALAAFEGIFGR